MSGVNDLHMHDGPSARARETLLDLVRRPADHRAVRACAGNTFTTATPAAGNAGHPRVRGKHTCPECRKALGIGPSARARETRADRLRASPEPGAIRACAGNTPLSRSAAPCPPGLPRVRGKHRTITIWDHKFGGPSARARETLRQRHQPESGHPRCREEGNAKIAIPAHMASRAIRACAGNTASAAA